MKKIVIKIPKEVIEPAIEQVKEFIGIGNIGKVYIPGDWNNWGDSPEKAGCIRPNPEMKMEKTGNYYVWEGKLSIGVHGFKPTVVKAEADENGMTPAIWIVCPTDGIDEYIKEISDRHGNWLVKVRP